MEPTCVYHNYTYPKNNEFDSFLFFSVLVLEERTKKKGLNRLQFEGNSYLMFLKNVLSDWSQMPGSSIQ